MSKDNEIRTDCRKLNVVNCHRAVSARCTHRSCRLRLLPIPQQIKLRQQLVRDGNVQLINGSADPSKVLQPRHTYNVFPSKDVELRTECMKVQFLHNFIGLFR